MTELLRKAVDRLSKLSDEDQDGIARWLLAEVESDEKWRDLIHRSREQLSALADEALAEHRSGLTEKLDPNRL